MRVLTFAAAALTLALAAAPAGAQAAAGYDCRGFGGGSRCAGAQPMTAQAPVRPVKRERPAKPRTARPLSSEGTDAVPAADWRRRLGDAILEGRCQDAKRIALEFGSVDMAVKAVRLCRPGPWLPLS